MHPDRDVPICVDSHLESACLAYIRLRLAGNTQLYDHCDGVWSIIHDGERKLSFRLPEGKLQAVFSRLAHEGWPLSELKPMLQEPPAALSVTEQIGRLWRVGWLLQVLTLNGKVAASLHARGEVRIVPQLIDPAESVVLSECGCIRKQGMSLLVESTEVGGAVEICDPTLFQVLAGMGTPRTIEELAKLSGSELPMVMAFVAWLATIGMACLPDESSVSQDAFAGWGFPDRLMHARSRSGRHVGGYGATFPGRYRISESAPRRREGGEVGIELPAVNLPSIRKHDLPFTEVLESRESVREHSAEPMTLTELGEFLYRTARIKSVYRMEKKELAARPFPSAGGLYELEFYPLVHRCDRLPPSLYRYDGEKHMLVHVSEPSHSTHQMLSEAVQCCGFRGDPHILIVLAARFLRVNRKYESIAYSLILKNVGVVYQTMYLVATAMNLAPCALGGGSALHFCTATKTNYWEESVVGEFMLGRRPAQDLLKKRSTEGI